MLGVSWGVAWEYPGGNLGGILGRYLGLVSSGGGGVDTCQQPAETTNIKILFENCTGGSTRQQFAPVKRPSGLWGEGDENPPRSYS
jgi:hypothetical protein